MIVSLEELLEYIYGRIVIASANDIMVFTSNKGGPVNIDIPDGTYTGDQLATALDTAMTANATLTGSGGSTINWAVSYGETTGKLTIDAGSGNTIALTISGSDAASTLGFVLDKSAAQSITSDQPIPGNPASIDVDVLHDAIEKEIKNYIDWDPEATTHTNKRYDGNGSEYLFLDELYVSAVQRVANGRTNAMKIKNTATDASNAYVSVASTTLSLTVVGGSSASSTNLSLTTYSTMTTIVAAINAYGNDWSAEVYDTDFNSYPSTNLLQIENQFAGSWNGVAASWYYLDMADKPLEITRVYKNRGMIQSLYGFPEGDQNIAVSYTAGWDSTNMPPDLKQAVMDMVKYRQNRTSQDTTGVKSFSTGHYSVTYATSSNNTIYDIPDEIMVILDRYKRIDV